MPDTSDHQTRNFRQLLDPINLGQTRAGFIIAAIFVACWQLGQTALADASNPGYSENEYFRVDWDYNFAAGTGVIIFSTDDPDLDIITLREADFLTHGARFNTIRIDGSGAPYTWRALVDEWYRYQLYHDIDFGLYDPLQLDVTFEAGALKPLPTDLTYCGTVASAAPFPLVIPPSTMNFVTIQPIPEPPGAAALAAVAMAASVFARRRQ